MRKEQIEAKKKKVIWDLGFTECLFGVHPENLTCRIFEKDADTKSVSSIEEFNKKFSKRTGDLENLDEDSKFYYFSDISLDEVVKRGFVQLTCVGKQAVPVFMQETVKVPIHTTEVGAYTQEEISNFKRSLESVLNYGHDRMLRDAKLVLITGNMDSRNNLVTVLIVRSDVSKDCFELNIRNIIHAEEKMEYVIA